MNDHLSLSRTYDEITESNNELTRLKATCNTVSKQNRKKREEEQVEYMQYRGMGAKGIYLPIPLIALRTCLHSPIDACTCSSHM